MENLLKYAQNLNANAEVLTWLNTAARAALRKQKATESEIEHILDYLVTPSAPNRLLKLSVKDALIKAEAWSKTQQKKGKHLIDSSEDIKTIHDFKDGTKIVQLLTKNAVQREGFFMAHCVGGYDPSSTVLYSYRDAKNEPHATFEVTKNGNEIMQIKGKGNGLIHPKYIEPILVFLKTIGKELRPSEMKNLGYYQVSQDQLKMLSIYNIELDKKISTLYGVTYAHG